MRKALVLLVMAAGTARADEPHAELRLESGRPHANVPFIVDLVVDGLDESPQPDPPTLELAGARVTALPAQPNVSHSIQIINGRRSDSTRVAWVFRWRVEVDKDGRLHVPSLTVVQGGKRATAAAGDVDVDVVPTTDDMKLELALPDRPVFVGETFEAKLTWLFRRQPQDQTFAVPLATLDDFTVSAPPAVDPRRAIQISAGAKDLELPYDVDDVDVGGVKWKRVTVRLFAAPRKAGKVAVPASSVVAGLAVGRPDFFGQAPSRLFRVSDVARTIEVKPLPETDRPASFAGAVGSQFSITAATSRSVVQLGEPVELAITVKSNQRLDTLALGDLGLPKDKFTVPAEPPTGELADEGKTKTFKVTAQVIGQATEIPSIALAYFDPIKGTYQTIHSDPIAVSVKGGSVVGASDVVAATPRRTAAPAEVDLALVGADLALSAPGDADDRQLAGRLLWIIVGLLYSVPLAVFGVRSWQLRTRSRRQDAAEVREAKRRVEHELARATREPARDTAGSLASALRRLARVLGRPVEDGGLLAQIETESFAPAAASAQLSPELVVRVGELVRRWTADAHRSRGKAAVVALVVLASVTPARAEPGSSDEPVEIAFSHSFDEARDTYNHAMTLTDASKRKAEFAHAAALLARIAAAAPDRPELVTDWGTAALGAGDVATATLAYRRALAIDGGNVRARRNLAWLRSRQADALRTTADSAADTLFFFHQWPRTRRLLVGALAFAIAVLLVVPWAGRRRRGMVALAALPFAAWLVLVVSLVVEDRHVDDAVVMDAVVLRAADSTGAPAAMSQPLPRGAEVTVLDRRDAWTKIRLANGTAGWIPGGAVERIHE